jgi:hypothetical protein
MNFLTLPIHRFQHEAHSFLRLKNLNCDARTSKGCIDKIQGLHEVEQKNISLFSVIYT